MSVKVPAFLLDRTFRFFALRLVWVSAIVNLGATIYYLRCPGGTKSIAHHILLILPPTIIALHHLLGAFLGLPWIIDILLEVGEIASLVIILKGNYRTNVGWQYQPTDFWLRISTYHILIAFLGLLILIRLAWVTDGWSRGANVFSRMDIREKRYERRRVSTSINGSSSIDVEKVGRKKKLQSTWARSAGALAGRSIWRRHIAGEPRFLALLRGAIFVIFLALLVGFLFFMAIMGPIQELALTSSKMLLMEAIPWGMPPLTEDNKWIVRVKQPTTKDNTMYALADAVKVYPLWEPGSQATSTQGSNRRSLPVALDKRQDTYSTIPMPSQVGPPSSAPDPPPTSTTSVPEPSSTSSAAPTPTPTGGALPLVAGAPPCIPTSSELESVIFECQARQQIPKEQLLNALDTDSPDILDNAFPDLLVIVDFAALGKAIEQTPTAVSQINVRHHSVHVALALTDNVDEINEFVPIPLVPGINLLGITDLIMRQRSTQPVLSTMGWPDLFNTSMAAELAYVVNDPHAALFDLPPGPNIATIRFSARNKATTWRVKQDAREKSVLSGLSSAGGLGSLLGTVFLFLFGSSLLGIMFGIKPLSPFGVLHNLCSSIAEGSQQRYASLHTDIEKIHAERGVMKYLFDVLIDLDLIVKAIVVEDSVDSDELESSTSSLGRVAGSVNEGESDNEGEDRASPPPTASHPLMNESGRASSYP